MTLVLFEKILPLLTILYETVSFTPGSVNIQSIPITLSVPSGRVLVQEPYTIPTVEGHVQMITLACQ